MELKRLHNTEILTEYVANEVAGGAAEPSHQFPVSMPR
jgi:hypothetical protein